MYLVRDLKSSVKDDLKNVSLTLHWDGKLLPDLTSNEKVGNLPDSCVGLRSHSTSRSTKITERDW